MVTMSSPGRVEFQISAPNARSAAVVGDFNDWDPTCHRMRRTRAGTWICWTSLLPGCYEYKYLIDGQLHVEDVPAGRWDPADEPLTVTVGSAAVDPSIYLG